MRVQVVDPSAYTPPYDHALCQALAGAGAEVELVTSAYAYGERPRPEGYAIRELFYRHSLGAPGSRLRRMAKLLEHGPDMLRLRRWARDTDVVHFQWLAVQWLDRHLLPEGPLVLTAHDLLPREPRLLQAGAQRRLYEAVDAVITHSEYGRRLLVERLGVAEERVHVIHHGAFDHLAEIEDAGLPPELDAPLPPSPGAQVPAAAPPGEGSVVLFFGLLRPYKGVGTLIEAWRSLRARGAAADAELWVVGHPRMALPAGGPGVRLVPRFVSDAEMAACFRRAEIVVLPYLATERLDFSGVLAAALAFGKPTVVSDVGGFGELAAEGAVRLVAPGDASGLASAIGELLGDPRERAHLAEAARRAAAGPYSWREAAVRTLALYRQLVS